MAKGSLNELPVGGSGITAVVGTPFEALDGTSRHEILRFAQDHKRPQDDKCPPDHKCAEDDAFARNDKFWKFSEDRPQSRLFDEITRVLLRGGNGIRFHARGASMSPAICDGEIVHVKSVVLAELREGDIVLAKGELGFRLHRLVVADAQQDVFITRGDCGQQDDPAVSGAEIVGIAVAKEVRVGRRNFQAKFLGSNGRMLRTAARGQRIM